MDNKRLWYIVQTYSGFENSVKENLKRRIETMQMEGLIFEVMIPEELKTEKKADGSTKEKMMPEEINPILKKCGMLSVQKLNAQIGQSIKVANGPFSGQIGTIEAINDEKGIVKILVDMFGRKTPIDLDFADIEII
jgi:transcriptional antiterminator NusG